MGKRRLFATLRSRIVCYFAIVLLPLLIILSYAYSHFVQNESRETLSRISMTLEAGTQSVDTSIDAAKKACITLFYDNRVKRHLKPISLSSTEDRAAQVEIHSTINAMVAITDAITETMLLYMDDQYVFSDGLYSFEDYFNTLYSFADYDADYWRSLLDQRIILEMLPATHMTQKRVSTTQTVIPVVYTTSVSGRTVVAVITLSVDSMVATVRNNLSTQGMKLVILDKENRLVYEDFDTGLIRTNGMGGYERIQLDDAPYHVISTTSQQSGLQYYLAVPDSVIYAMSDDYLLFIVAALVMCLVAGGLAVYFSYKISRPIQRIYSSIGDKTGEEPKSLQDVSQRFSFFLSNYQEAKEEERSLRTSFVEMAVLRLLSGHDTHIQDLTRQLERECAFTDPVYQLCVVEVAFSQEQEAFRDTERINMQLNFRGDLAEYLSHTMPCLVLEERPNQYICLVNHSVEDEALYDIMAYLLKQMEENPAVQGMDICVGKGCALRELAREYELVVRCLNTQAPEQHYTIRWAEETQQPAAVAFTIKDEMQLLSTLRGNNKEKMYDLVRQMLAECARVSQEQEKLRIHDLFVTGMRYLAERDVTLPTHSLYRGLRADVELPGGIVAKRKLLNEFYHELTDVQSIGSESNLTASIVAYVEKHYSSDLYLERIAQELGLSVKYISKVFKEKTGRNLSDYINEVRIQHVKEMLMQTDMSIASISEAAGIYSRSTLIRLFRKYEGVTPSEYRELAHGQKS